VLIYRNLSDVIFRFAPDDAQGGGDSGNQSQQTSQSNSGNSQEQGSGGSQSNDNQGLAKLLQRYDNDALRVAETLLGDNFKLREKNRQLEGQTEGAVVLRGADKDTYAQYQALGAPSEIATKLRRGDIERIANKVGYDADIFADLDRQAGGKLVYEVKAETVDGNATERVYVKDGSQADAAPQLLTDFAAAKWGKYLPALQPTAQNSEGVGTQSSAQQGTRFPPQGTGGSGSQVTNDYAKQFLQKQEEQNKGIKNPLLNQ
jgi:hypothetical protein